MLCSKSAFFGAKLIAHSIDEQAHKFSFESSRREWMAFISAKFIFILKTNREKTGFQVRLQCIVCHAIPCQFVAITHEKYRISPFIIICLTGMRFALSCYALFKIWKSLKIVQFMLNEYQQKTKTKQTKPKRKKNKANGRLLSLSHFPWFRGRITAHCFHLTRCIFCLPICLPVCFSAAARIGSNWACERAGRRANKLTSKQTYEWSKSESHEKSCKFIFIRSILHN